MAAGWIFSSSNLGMQSDQVPLGYEPLGAFFTAKAKSRCARLFSRAFWNALGL